MTERYMAVTVVLEHDLRADDAEALLNAIRMLRGVISVEPHVSALENHVAYERVRRQLTDKLWAVLRPDNPARGTHGKQG